MYEEIIKLLAHGFSIRRQKKLYKEIMKIVTNNPVDFARNLMEYYCKDSSVIKKIYKLEKHKKIKKSYTKKAKKKLLKYFWRFSKILVKIKDKIFSREINNQLSILTDEISTTINLSDLEFLKSCKYYYEKNEEKKLTQDIFRKDLDIEEKIPFEDELDKKIVDFKKTMTYRKTAEEIEKHFENNDDFRKIFPNGISNGYIYRRITENPKYSLKKRL